MWWITTPKIPKEYTTSCDGGGNSAVFCSKKLKIFLKKGVDKVAEGVIL